MCPRSLLAGQGDRASCGLRQALMLHLLCCFLAPGPGTELPALPDRTPWHLWAPALQSPVQGTLLMGPPCPCEGHSLSTPPFHAQVKRSSGPLPPGCRLELGLVQIPAWRPLDPSPVLASPAC